MCLQLLGCTAVLNADSLILVFISDHFYTAISLANIAKTRYNISLYNTDYCSFLYSLEVETSVVTDQTRQK